jgi:Ca2+-binding RTX toxin-like protein
VDDCGCDPDSPSHDVIESYSDELYGGDGDDKVYGQLGDDTLYGGEGADTLSGGDGNDVVYGGNGNDILDGGIGTDFLYGGAGDDTISGGAGFDVIFGGDGNDTVSYSASPSAVNVDLASFWQSGGDASSDYLSEMMSSLSSGSSPSDVMMSAVFLSLLNSIGATGTESSFTLSIPDVLLGIESVTGSAYDDTLSGNALANTLKGGAGADVIDGRGGNDILYGNAGQDTFVFDTVLNVTTNVDSIMDFSVVDDSVQLDQTIFSVLQTGQLASAAFFQGTSAHDSDDRIIYDSASGNLYYDPDGNGSAAQTVIAHLSTGLALTNADFLVVS